MREKKFLIILVVSMVISGSINTLDSKFQNQQQVQQSGYSKYFYHPYMQTYVIYIATSLAFPIFHLRKRFKKYQYAKPQSQERHSRQAVRFNKARILICTVSNMIANTFQNIALNFISGSVYQMTRGGTIATTFVFSVFYLKIRPKKHQKLGSFLALLGVLIVGLSNLLFSQASSKNTKIQYEILGYCLLIASLFLNGFSLTFEENLIRTYYIEPIELTGYEGIFGLILYSFVLVAFTFIPCSFGNNACVLYNGEPYLERPDVYIKQLGDHYPLLITSIIQIFSLLIFNISGLSITKYINALARSICDVTRTVIIWLVGIIVTVTVGETSQNYRWQSIKTGSIILQLIGFAVLILGNLIYNQIVKLECLQQQEEISSYMTIQQKKTSSQPL